MFRTMVFALMTRPYQAVFFPDLGMCPASNARKPHLHVDSDSGYRVCNLPNPSGMYISLLQSIRLNINNIPLPLPPHLRQHSHITHHNLVHNPRRQTPVEPEI